MAVRSPMKLNGSDLQEMSSSEITAIQNRARYLYAQNPSVVLSYQNNGNLAGMSDTRKQASNMGNNAAYYPGFLGVQYQGYKIGYNVQGQAPTLGTITVSYDRIHSTNQSASQPSDGGLTFPLYWDGSALRAMSETDMYDTFILSAASGMADGSDRGGTFRIHTSTSLSGHTLISSTPIFSDTRYNTGVVNYTSPSPIYAQFAPGANYRFATGLGSTSTTASATVTNYYLFRSNDTSNPSYSLPMYYDGSNTVQEYTQSNFDTILSNFIRHTLANVGGYRLAYSINGSGNQRGSTMTDTRLNGFQYAIQFVNANDYRAQVFPAGSSSTIANYALRITQF